ncbi:MAG TPA: polysaccharide deacetylase family protein, partial [Methylomirabilota bacterium]|nr:polysaccharide deacetylase family protein [Methylomirabilota bacterium]
AECRRDCEAILGTPVQLFAYPYGDVDAECRSAAAAAGMTLAVTTEAAAYGRADNVFAIPRLQVPGDWSGADLMKRIHALAST